MKPDDRGSYDDLRSALGAATLFALPDVVHLLVQKSGLEPQREWESAILTRLESVYGGLWKAAQGMEHAADDAQRRAAQIVKALCATEYVFRIKSVCELKKAAGEDVVIAQALDAVPTPLQEALDHVRQSLHASVHSTAADEPRH